MTIPNANNSRLNVRVFSVLAERTGEKELIVDMNLPTTGSKLLDRLGEQFPAVSELRSFIRLAVNHEYVDADHPVTIDDEIAIITPTSGG